MCDIERKTADRMRRLCSRREYCAADIRKKLIMALEGDMDAVKRVLDVLVEEKYVDDFRYASAYARDKAGIAGWGVMKIRYFLSGKGVSKEVIDSALEEIDTAKADARLEKLLYNKHASLKDDPQCRMKLLRFALGRGYSYDDVAVLVDKITRK